MDYSQVAQSPQWMKFLSSIGESGTSRGEAIWSTLDDTTKRALMSQASGPTPGATPVLAAPPPQEIPAAEPVLAPVDNTQLQMRSRNMSPQDQRSAQAYTTGMQSVAANQASGALSGLGGLTTYAPIADKKGSLIDLTGNITVPSNSYANKALNLMGAKNIGQEPPAQVPAPVLANTDTPVLAQDTPQQQLFKPDPAILSAMNRPAVAPAQTQAVQEPVLVDTNTGAGTTNTAVLTDNTAPPAKVTPILADKASAARATGGPVTANARGSSMPNNKISMGEALMRMGGAGLAENRNGYGASMGATFKEYGSIQDANRTAEMEAYKQAEATRLTEAKMRAAAATAGAKGAKGSSEELTAANDMMFSYQSALDAIASSKAAGGNLTGVGGIFKGFFDNFTGDADAARRLILSRVKVDDALLRVANTKGAISNREMELFLEPAPNNLMDEQVWVDWLMERQRALQRVQGRLANGDTVPDSDRPGMSTKPAAQSNSTDADTNALLDQYAPTN